MIHCALFSAGSLIILVFLFTTIPSEIILMKSMKLYFKELRSVPFIKNNTVEKVTYPYVERTNLNSLINRALVAPHDEILGEIPWTVRDRSLDPVKSLDVKHIFLWSKQNKVVPNRVTLNIKKPRINNNFSIF